MDWLQIFRTEDTLAPWVEAAAQVEANRFEKNLEKQHEHFSHINSLLITSTFTQQLARLPVIVRVQLIVVLLFVIVTIYGADLNGYNGCSLVQRSCARFHVAFILLRRP